MSLKRQAKFLVSIAVIPLLVSCASSSDEKVESIRTKLDAADYAGAVTDGEALVKSLSGKADTTSTAPDAGISVDEIDARLLLSDAYFGRAKLSLLDLVKILTGVIDSSAADFLEFKNAIASVLSTTASGISTTDFRSAAAVLEVVRTNNQAAFDGLKDALGQLAGVQALEGFLLPVILSGDTPTNTLIETGITAASATTINNDFTTADNNYTTAGTTNASFLGPIRTNYCFCEMQAGVSGMTEPCIEDLMKCELLTTGTACPKGDYDANGTASGGGECSGLSLAAGLLDCVSLLAPAAANTTTCNSSDTGTVTN